MTNDYDTKIVTLVIIFDETKIFLPPKVLQKKLKRKTKSQLNSTV